MANPKPKIALLLILIVALAATGYWWYSDHQRADAALVLYGNVDIREVALAFRQAGRVAAIHVEEGDQVKKDEVLAELDARPYRDALAAARAALMQAEALHAKLLAGSRKQEVAAARDSVKEVAAVFRQRDEELARQTQLIKQGDTSRKVYDAAFAAREVAAANLSAAQQKLSLLEEGARSEDIAAAAAQVAAAQAQVAIAQTALTDSELVSPADGVVMSRVREPGSMVNSQAAVLTLSLRHPTYVRAYVDEPDLARIAPGQLVNLTIDGSQRTYHGHIGFISPRAEFTPKSVETTDLRTDLVYRIRIVVSDDDNQLKQGMPVTITLASGS